MSSPSPPERVRRPAFAPTAESPLPVPAAAPPPRIAPLSPASVAAAAHGHNLSRVSLLPPGSDPATETARLAAPPLLGALGPHPEPASPQSRKPPTLADYLHEAQAMVGGMNRDPRKRNDAISGAYASLFLKNPAAFRWVGAAAHASTQVGLTMDVFDDFQQLDHALNGPLPSLLAAPGSLALQNTGVNAGVRQMLADGNRAIFESIFPPSLAYDRGGIEELRRLHKTLKDGKHKRQAEDFAPILRAYETIDRGVKLKQQGRAREGEDLLEAGTDQIITHEQRDIAQPTIFGKSKKNERLSTMLSPFAFGDFDGDPSRVDAKTVSALQDWNPGADIGNVNQRIEWIQKGVFPTWHGMCRQETGKVHQGMKRMIRRGQAAGGRY